MTNIFSTVVVITDLLLTVIFELQGKLVHKEDQHLVFIMDSFTTEVSTYLSRRNPQSSVEATVLGNNNPQTFWREGSHIITYFSGPIT